jgi:hypothetical protein
MTLIWGLIWAGSRSMKNTFTCELSVAQLVGFLMVEPTVVGLKPWHALLFVRCH